ncbi:DUF456 domain-containing protein [Gilvibacter sp.]|uniref:DUF456 domain-containing protein n=1 Tax=Gilvibacter sp. TaxID=2729997 RepID=UPI003F4A14F9
MLDIFLVILGLLLCFGGIVGSVLPVLPGPPISWLGLLMLFLTSVIPVNYWFLGITLVVAILMVVLDYVIPAIGTKRFGGSRAGAIGTTVGLVVGLIAPIPFGVLIGPFVGAFIGEIAFNQTESNQALKAAFGSFLGFLASTFMKLVVCFIYLGFYINYVYTYFDGFF